ncbi:MAG: two-component regulator propeller domain-containing protein [Crocinitomicaceae bacterium]|nr:two-component regulator propeller domain-containing protein [Crocinitomicaceae bacterium]
MTFSSCNSQGKINDAITPLEQESNPAIRTNFTSEANVIYRDKKDNLWFGTSNLGVYLFDGKEIRWMYESQHVESPEGGNFGVRSIGEDQDGHYWISNAHYRYEVSPIQTETEGLQAINYKRKIGVEKKAKEDLYLYSMETDRNGDLLMFAKEDGLWRNNGEELTEFFIEDGEKSISPTSMYKDYQGMIWLESEQDGIYKYDGTSFEKFQIN